MTPDQQSQFQEKLLLQYLRENNYNVPKGSYINTKVTNTRDGNVYFSLCHDQYISSMHIDLFDLLVFIFSKQRS